MLLYGVTILGEYFSAAWQELRVKGELLTTWRDAGSAASRRTERLRVAERATAARGKRKRRRAKGRGLFGIEHGIGSTVFADTRRMAQCQAHANFVCTKI